MSVSSNEPRITTAQDNMPVVSSAVGEARSPNHCYGKQKCAVDKSCDGRDENRRTSKIPKLNRNCDSQRSQSNKMSLRQTSRKCTDGAVVSVANGREINSSDVVDNHLSLYGFNAADWLDDSFTDDHASIIVKPLARNEYQQEAGSFTAKNYSNQIPVKVADCDFLYLSIYPNSSV